MGDLVQFVKIVQTIVNKSSNSNQERKEMVMFEDLMSNACSLIGRFRPDSSKMLERTVRIVRGITVSSMDYREGGTDRTYGETLLSLSAAADMFSPAIGKIVESYGKILMGIEEVMLKQKRAKQGVDVGSIIRAAAEAVSQVSPDYRHHINSLVEMASCLQKQVESLQNKQGVRPSVYMGNVRAVVKIMDGHNKLDEQMKEMEGMVQVVEDLMDELSNNKLEKSETTNKIVDKLVVIVGGRYPKLRESLDTVKSVIKFIELQTVSLEKAKPEMTELFSLCTSILENYDPNSARFCQSSLSLLKTIQKATTPLSNKSSDPKSRLQTAAATLGSLMWTLSSIEPNLSSHFSPRYQFST